MKKRLLTLVSSCAMAASQAAVLTATDTTFGVFDLSRAARSFSMGAGTVVDVDISITLAKCDVAIGPNDMSCTTTDTPFYNEISLNLTDAHGEEIRLIALDQYVSGVRDANPGRVTLRFDASAPSVAGGYLRDGTFQPIDLMSRFNGKDALGEWSLTVGDWAAGDPLMYFSSQLTITTLDDVGQVPEPASLALLGIGLAGLAASRRRKH